MYHFLIKKIVGYTLFISLTFSVAISKIANAEDYNLVNPGYLTIGNHMIAGINNEVDGEYQGVFAEITKTLAKRMELELVFKWFDFAALIPTVQSGRVDAIGPALSVTQSRAQVFNYGEVMFLQPECLSVRNGETIESWEDAADRGLTLATVVGYFQIGIWEELGINVRTFDNTVAAFTDLVNGGSDGVGVGCFELSYYQSQHPDSDIATKLTQMDISGPTVTVDMNTFGLIKTNPGLARELQQQLKDMWRSGEIEAAYKKVLGEGRYDPYINSPAGQAIYYPGPWEGGAAPPASDVYGSVDVANSGTLTVGVVENSPLLSVSGSTLSGPEAKILQYAADKFNLKLVGVAISDATAALNDGTVDVVAGAVVQNEADSHQVWYTTPTGFNPDYIYVKPGDGGGYPGFGKWEDVEGKIAVVSGNSRIADMKATGADVMEVSDTHAGLHAVADGSAAGFVGSTLDFVDSQSRNPDLGDANIGFVRNVNSHTYGEAYSFAVKWGNASLCDGLSQAIAAQWQNKSIAGYYARAFAGANSSALIGPGPTTVGTGYSSSMDYSMKSIFFAGAWTQRPTWKQ